MSPPMPPPSAPDDRPVRKKRRIVVPSMLLVVFGVVGSLGCVEAPEVEFDPVARVIVAWDPLQCGEPHRVAVEIEDDDGIPSSTSTTCAAGSVSLDVRHFGIYRGRIYAWDAGAIRSEMDMYLAVDEPITRWFVPTPR